MTSACTVQVYKSTKDFQLNEHIVVKVRTRDESDWQVKLLFSESLLQPPELQP